MKEVYKVLGNKFRNIIIDTPPFRIISDLYILNEMIHNVVLVSRYGKTNINDLRNTIFEFTNIKKDILGIIINASKEVKKHDYYPNSYYHY